jgi:YHS domain-containing protein
MSGFRQASVGGRAPGTAPIDAPRSGTDLHKDPICGTYVVESTRLQRLIGGQRFYYCSEECQEKHALVKR